MDDDLIARVDRYLDEQTVYWGDTRDIVVDLRDALKQSEAERESLTTRLNLYLKTTEYLREVIWRLGKALRRAEVELAAMQGEHSDDG